MKKRVLVMVVLVLTFSALGEVWAATFDEPVQLPPGRTDQQEKSQEDDCDCCQKCKAAKKPITTSEEGSEDGTSGCEQCCERCGRKLPSGPDQSAPPDIIEKRDR